MTIVVLAVLLSIMQAGPPSPREAANNAARTSQNVQKDAKNDQDHPTAAVSPTTTNPNTSTPNKTDSDKQRSEDANHPIIIGKLPTVTVAAPKRDWVDWGYWGFSLLLVGVGGFQVLLLWGTLKSIKRQANAMERQEGILTQNVEIAKQNADAALLNAKALITAERPWIMVHIVAKPTPQPARVTFEFNGFNYGKSPAHIISCNGPTIDFVRNPKTDLPLSPNYRPCEAEQTFVGPRDSFPMAGVDPWSVENHTLRAGKASRENISRESLVLIAYGLIEYTDGIAEKPYKTAYCYRWKCDSPSDMKGRLIQCGPTEYNRYT
jgi:hypothetical protein